MSYKGIRPIEVKLGSFFVEVESEIQLIDGTVELKSFSPIRRDSSPVNQVSVTSLVEYLTSERPPTDNDVTSTRGRYQYVTWSGEDWLLERLNLRRPQGHLELELEGLKVRGRPDFIVSSGRLEVGEIKTKNVKKGSSDLHEIIKRGLLQVLLYKYIAEKKGETCEARLLVLTYERQNDRGEAKQLYTAVVKEPVVPKLEPIVLQAIHDVKQLKEMNEGRSSLC
ncbi:PD-(D/E)XK nuclease family protein [Sulfodiicoccus acidiphilus]|uniref:PD-(D/E)XK nuclease family protein n=1 Tax=Sulfodiicoccus acidiphilus TaxID=1670455 RepID=UPI0026800353